jgi:hypothetical protein
VKRVVLALAVVLSGLALAGCDDRPCLKSHTEHYLMPTLIGKVIVPMPQVREVCDEYGEAPR